MEYSDRSESLLNQFLLDQNTCLENQLIPARHYLKGEYFFFQNQNDNWSIVDPLFEVSYQHKDLCNSQTYQDRETLYRKLLKICFNVILGPSKR